MGWYGLDWRGSSFLQIWQWLATALAQNVVGLLIQGSGQTSVSQLVQLSPSSSANYWAEKSVINSNWSSFVTLKMFTTLAYAVSNQYRKSSKMHITEITGLIQSLFCSFMLDWRRSTCPSVIFWPVNQELISTRLVFVSYYFSLKSASCIVICWFYTISLFPYYNN